MRYLKTNIHIFYIFRYIGHKTDDMNIESAISTKDTHVLSGSISGDLWCWDLITAKVEQKFLHTPRKVLNSISVHPKKDVILTASVNTIKVWGQPEDIPPKVEKDLD